MTRAEVRDMQRTLNRFTHKYLRGVRGLRVDGKRGRATNSRIMLCKYYLGYGPDRNAAWRSLTVRRLRHPHSTKYSSRKMLATAFARRARQRARWRAHQVHATVTPGVGRFDGVPCAKWLIPYLAWARRSGLWHGRLVSGWRARWYSRLLCRRMCNRDYCPGLCAGTRSRHVGDVRPDGALDVSDYVGFGRAMARCPYRPRLFNALPRDRVHYSAFGN